MNRGEIRTRVIKALREDLVNPSGWTEVELNSYIDDGYGMVAEAIKSVIRVDDIPVPAFTHFLALPGDCIQIFEMKDQATEFPIDPVEDSWIDERDEEWIRRLGQRPRFAAPFGLEELILYPAYDAPGIITITMAVYPAAIGSDGFVPDIPEEYHHALIDYARHRALVRDARTPEMMERAMGHYRRFAETLRGAEGWAQTRLGHLSFGVGWGPRLRTPVRITHGAGD